MGWRRAERADIFRVGPPAARLQVAPAFPTPGAAEVHTQVGFAVPAGEKGGMRGVINLIFRVAGGGKIVDYQRQREPVPAAVEAGARHWEQLAGEAVVERGGLFETGI